MHKPIKVKALPKYRLWVQFEDGLKGEVDLSYLVGKGVFSVWKNFEIYKKVRIGSSGEIIWNDILDLCPDSLYMKISGKTPEQVFPNLRQPYA